MTAHRLLLPILALAASVVLPAAAHARPLAGLAVPSVSDETSDAAIAKGLDVAQRAHMAYVRMEVRWDALEPDASGVQDAAYLGRLDALSRLAADRRLKLYLTIVGTPCWASAAPARIARGCADVSARNAAATYPPVDPQQFARVAGQLAGRFASRLVAFEVWNEPDQSNELYFAGPDKVARYTALLKAAYPAIKAAAPQVPVLGAAIVGGDGRFLKALYAAGIKGSYDVLSVHFYDVPLYSLAVTRKVQKANGDTKPVWLGEFGWTSCAPKAKTEQQHTCVTRRIQGQNLSDVFRAIRSTSWLRGALVYAATDEAAYQFGLTDTAWKAKPAFTAVRSVLAHTPASRRIKLRVRASKGRILITGSAPGGDFYQVNLRQNGVLRYRAQVRLRTDGTLYLKVPAVLKPTAGTRVSIYGTWAPSRKVSARLR
jgi:hypothetical protein